ncbi:chalcone isomerase family protein [bacterium]|nr:chalcone isomerase family protein [bacterium]
MKSAFFVFASALLLSLFITPVNAQVGGPATFDIGQTEVVRNGFGSRNKMMLSLYECSLYLPQKSNDAATIVAAEQPMAVRLKITSRFVSQEKMLAALREGFQSSTGGSTASIASDIAAFTNCFSDPIQMDDVFIMAYMPNSGVVVYKNNQQKGIVGGPEFKKALFGIWLGNNPIDANLKNALLGK